MVNWKKQNKLFRSSAAGVTVSMVLSIGIQLLGCGIVSLLVERGQVGEGATAFAGMVIHIIGMATVTLVSWLLAAEKKLLCAAVCAGFILVIPGIGAMLFWGLDLSAFALRTITVVPVFGLLAWCLSRGGNKRVWSNKKMQYR